MRSIRNAIEIQSQSAHRDDGEPHAVPWFGANERTSSSCCHTCARVSGSGGTTLRVASSNQLQSIMQFSTYKHTFAWSRCITFPSAPANLTPTTKGRHSDYNTHRNTQRTSAFKLLGTGQCEYFILSNVREIFSTKPAIIIPWARGAAAHS